MGFASLLFDSRMVTVFKMSEGPLTWGVNSWTTAGETSVVTYMSANPRHEHGEKTHPGIDRDHAHE